MIFNGLMGQPHSSPLSDHDICCTPPELQEGQKNLRGNLLHFFFFFAMLEMALTCCLSWCISLSRSLFRASTSSWVFFLLEADSSSNAMLASFSLMAASRACCLKTNQDKKKCITHTYKNCRTFINSKTALNLCQIQFIFNSTSQLPVGRI